MGCRAVTVQSVPRYHLSCWWNYKLLVTATYVFCRGLRTQSTKMNDDYQDYVYRPTTTNLQPTVNPTLVSQFFLKMGFYIFCFFFMIIINTYIYFGSFLFFWSAYSSLNFELPLSVTATMCPAEFKNFYIHVYSNWENNFRMWEKMKTGYGTSAK